MTTSDERRAAGREVQGPALAGDPEGPTGRFPAAKLAPDFFDHVQQEARSATSGRIQGLPVRDRSMITVAVLATPWGEPRSCVPPSQVSAPTWGSRARRSWRSLMHVSICTGVPQTGSTLRAAADVLGTD